MGRMVGIVGKPNVGKSTFFSAATLKSVPIANYPFTTIKANKGIGYVRVECVCKELRVEDNPVNSACIEGNRFIPVEMIDCAGLVPGAWQGRGLGNQFLDEIRRADALIHIVDASGSTDLEGRECSAGEHIPLEDITFLEEEIDRWLLGIIKKDWLKNSRRVESGTEKVESILENRLSGLAVKRKDINYAIKKVGLNPKKPTNWSDDDLLIFIRQLRRISKPMVIAANKIDIDIAKDNTKLIDESGYPTISCCAEAELALRRASQKELIKYLPGNEFFTFVGDKKINVKQKEALESIKKRILDKWGSTGVQQTINKAFLDLLKMIVVYPVLNIDKLTDHDGNILPEAYLVPFGTTAKEFANIIHTEIGQGFLYAIEVKTGTRVGEDYTLKNNDVISIVSTKRRG